MSGEIDPRFREVGDPDLPEMEIRPNDHYVPYWDTLGKVLPYAAPAAFLAAGLGLGGIAKNKKKEKDGA